MSDRQNTSLNRMIRATSEGRSGIVCNFDGTYTRTIQFSNTPATPDTNLHSPVLFKDVPLNPKHKTWIRLYLPKQLLGDPPSANKLPIIVYYHGGGFVYCSASSTIIHDFCVKMGAHLPAIIMSVDYRLAPEHRLPAAYEDAVEALHWIKISNEHWLTEFADMSSCFLMGTSAGGNIAYHAGLRVASKVDEFEPLKIQGLILHHAFFGGLGRTGSELRLIDDSIVTLSGSDHMWELSLPIGADRDHEYSNPTVNNGSDQLQSVRLVGWRILVTGCYDDLLIDRQIELANMLEEKGIRAMAHFGEGYHSIELFEESKAKELFGVLKNFISNQK